MVALTVPHCFTIFGIPLETLASFVVPRRYALVAQLDRASDYGSEG